MNFPEKYLVYDIRTSKDLKSSTISGYKKKDVVSAFENALINGQIEDSIKWCVELHISCYDKDIWKIFFQVYLKHIHQQNPKLFIYLIKRKKNYDTFLLYLPKQHYLFSRNNMEIRNLFAELTALLTNSPKSHLLLNKSLPSIQMKKMNAGELKKRMVAINNTEIERFLYSDTHSLVKLCLNEIYMHLKINHMNIQNCFFWYLYLEKNKEIHKIEDSNKSKSVLHFFDEEKRKNNQENQDELLKSHWSYILWSIILSFRSSMNKYDKVLLEKLEDYYKTNFKVSQITSKKYIFLYCFMVIKNNISWKKPLIYQEHIYIQSNANINNMYLNILKNIYKYLSDEQQDLYFKKYYKIINDYLPKDENIKKDNLDNIHENLNKILYQEHDFVNNRTSKQNKNQEITNQQNSQNQEQIDNKKSNLISKNKNLKDVYDEKEEKMKKKLDLFVNCFIQKKQIKSSSSIPSPKKNVFDYYQQDQNSQEDHKYIDYDHVSRNKGKHKKELLDKNLIIKL